MKVLETSFLTAGTGDDLTLHQFASEHNVRGVVALQIRVLHFVRAWGMGARRPLVLTSNDVNEQFLVGVDSGLNPNLKPFSNRLKNKI